MVSQSQFNNIDVKGNNLDSEELDAKAFGFELLLDLYGCKDGVCDDITLCYDFLEKLPTFISMDKQSPPGIFRTDELRWPDKAGLSGWVPLVESSIVIHTLTPKNFISVDVYSCKKFDPEKVKKFVKGYFAPKKIEEQYIRRGLAYHDAPEIKPMRRLA